MDFFKYIIIAVLIATCFEGCKPSIDKPAKYIGASKADIIKIIGEPIACNQFIFHKNVSLSEYQSDLYNIFQNVKAQDTIVIEECRWERKKRNLVIWWHSNGKKDELSIDCLEWTNNIEF
jgi:hypothetical protein